MGKKYKIGQIIKWEDKEKYFWNTKYPKKEFDLLHLQLIVQRKNSIFNTPIGILFKKKTKDLNYDDLGNDYIKFLAIWVGRPHNYKLGDTIKVDFKIRKCVLSKR